MQSADASSADDGRQLAMVALDIVNRCGDGVTKGRSVFETVISIEAWFYLGNGKGDALKTVADDHRIEVATRKQVERAKKIDPADGLATDWLLDRIRMAELWDAAVGNLVDPASARDLGQDDQADRSNQNNGSQRNAPGWTKSRPSWVQRETILCHS